MVNTTWADSGRRYLCQIISFSKQTRKKPTHSSSLAFKVSSTHLLSSLVVPILLPPRSHEPPGKGRLSSSDSHQILDPLTILIQVQKPEASICATEYAPSCAQRHQFVARSRCSNFVWKGWSESSLWRYLETSSKSLIRL